MKYHIYKTDENCAITDVDVSDIAISYGNLGTYSIKEIHFGGYSENPDVSTPNLIWKKDDSITTGNWPVYEDIASSKQISTSITIPVDGCYKIGLAAGGGGGVSRYRTHHDTHCEYTGGTGGYAFFNKDLKQGDVLSVVVGIGGAGDSCNYGDGGEGSSAFAKGSPGGNSTIYLNNTLLLSCTGGSGGYAASSGSHNGYNGAVYPDKSIEDDIEKSRFSIYRMPYPISYLYIDRLMTYISDSLINDDTKLPTYNTNSYEGIKFSTYYSTYLSKFSYFVTKLNKNKDINAKGAYEISKWEKFDDIPYEYYNNVKLCSIMLQYAKLNGTTTSIWVKDGNTGKFTNNLLKQYVAADAKSIYDYVISSIGINTSYSTGGTAVKKYGYTGSPGAISIVCKTSY